MTRVNATRSRRGPHFTRMGGRVSVRAVALRRTLRLFGLPHALKRCRNGGMIMNTKHFKPCVRGGNLCTSLPGAVSPVAIALRRTVRLLRGGRRTRTRGRVGGFRRRPRLRVLGKHCNPCVTCGNDGCGVPGSVVPRSLGLRTYLRVIGLRDSGSANGSGQATGTIGTAGAAGAATGTATGADGAG